jgi:SAM-dependent methyltransferase
MAPPNGLASELATFSERRGRSLYVARRFAPYLGDSVLDVGCYEAPLRELLTQARYVGVDMAGKPDITLDLDTREPLPFADASFRCVICIEVLEHLENLHHVFGELARVSAEHVIVSLPNCWRDARRPIERGRGHFAHYGLPAEPPQDRHRWFFSYTEACDFLRDRAARHGMEVVELFGTEMHRSALVRAARRALYPGARYFNRYVQTAWAVLRKPPPR